MIVKKYMLPLSVIGGVMLANSAAFAAPTANERQMVALEQQSHQLQQQLQAMQHEINVLKQQQNNQVSARKRLTGAHTYAAPSKADQSRKAADNQTGTPSWLYKIATPVVTSPYIGIYPSEMGSSLIVNFPSVNEDLVLLQQHQALNNKINNSSWGDLHNPFLTISGKIEAQAMRHSGYSPTGGEKVLPRRDIDLSAAELQISARMNNWVSGFFQIDYDNSLDPYASMVRQNNSRLFLNKGFITFGDLNKFPVYTSIGQMFVPYGRYASSMQNAPLNQSLTRTRARSIVVGYHGKAQKGLYAQTYMFNSENKDPAGNNYINWGGNLGYDFACKKLSGDFGVSYINSMADAAGLQGVGGVFADNTTLQHKVPGYAVHGILSYGDFTVLAELDQAMKAYDAADLQYNGRGAKFGAFNTELTYAFKVLGKATTFTLGLGQTRQAVVTGLPQRRYAAILNSEIFHDTIFSLEYDHDRNYSSDAQGSYHGATVQGSGGSANTVLAQVGIYF